ncbi:MAG: RNA polymerase sigma factor [Candidatus Latescibacterota bacterium]
MTEKERIYAELLALRCRRGDPGALEELVRAWEDRLFYFIRRLVPGEEDAWDALQETWMKVVRGVGKLRQPERLSPWLYTIARASAMDRMRAVYANHREEPVESEALEQFPDETEEFEDAERVHRGLDRISLPHREALTLHFLEDFTIEEIAGILGIPEGTVKSRLHHAKRALRAVLEREV